MTAGVAWVEHWYSSPEHPTLPSGDAPIPAPKPAMVAPAQRRRLSRVSKMALHAAGELLPQTGQADYAVFCSRHGELLRTFELLEQLVSGEELSPTAFAQSVHNTAAGHFCIAQKNQLATTTISAGEQTLAMGWIEACSYLSAHPHSRVLLVLFDEPVPDPYSPFLDQSEDCALALMLQGSPSRAGQKQLRLEIQPGTDKQASDAPISPMYSLAQLLQSGGELSYRCHDQIIRWSCDVTAA